MGKFDPKPKPPEPPTTVSIDLSIRADGGNGIPNADVQFLDQDGKTNQDGWIRFYVPVDTRQTRVEVSHPDYNTIVTFIMLDGHDHNSPDDFKFWLEPKEDDVWNKLTFDQLAKYKGNFCGWDIPDLPYQQFHVSFTPAFGCYTFDWQQKMLDTCKGHGDTHFVFNWRDEDDIYQHVYPPLRIQSDIVNQVKRIYKMGLIPIIPVLHDSDNDVHPDFAKIKEFIRLCFVKWEQNQPDKNNTYLMASNIWKVKHAVRTDCVVMIHCSQDHAALIGDDDLYYCSVDGEPFPVGTTICPTHGHTIQIIKSDNGESAWWNWAKFIGISGINFQYNQGAEIPDQIARGEDFTIRFGTGFHGWPQGMLFEEFEINALYRFHNGMTEANQVWWNRQLREHTYQGMQPQGYCNG